MGWCPSCCRIWNLRTGAYFTGAVGSWGEYTEPVDELCPACSPDDTQEPIE